MASDASPVAGMTGRYATALFELARDEGKLEPVEASLGFFAAALQESADLRRMIASPAFSAAEQTRALAALLKKFKLDPLTNNFLLVLARNRRLFAAGAIVKGFRALMAQHRGEIAAEVTSAAPLTADQLKELGATLQNRLGKTAMIETRIDPTLLGGLVVRIGSRMIDTSLKTKLNSLKIAMKEVG